jgi:hypothetical protein
MLMRLITEMFGAQKETSNMSTAPRFQRLRTYSDMFRTVAKLTHRM